MIKATSTLVFATIRLPIKPLLTPVFATIRLPIKPLLILVSLWFLIKATPNLVPALVQSLTGVIQMITRIVVEAIPIAAKRTRGKMEIRTEQVCYFTWIS